jgi:hypothetical protein
MQVKHHLRKNGLRDKVKADTIANAKRIVDLMGYFSCAKKKDGEKGESFWGHPDQRIKSVKFSEYVIDLKSTRCTA